VIVLSQTTDLIEVVLAGVITTNQLRCFASWSEKEPPEILNSGVVYDETYGRRAINTNNASDVTLVSAPASGYQRLVYLINIHNLDTVSANVTVKFSDNGTEYVLWKGDLAAGDTLVYSAGMGWG
jgi:hypothetical protein